MLAPAKINLMLHVTAKRDDGYHRLQSLVMFADVGDEVALTPSTEFTLRVTGEFAGLLQGDNLISKAANALALAANMKPHGTITLDKKLPIGAGLGGGSSDAAAALKLLADDWNIAAPLAKIATALGSDVPACLHGAPLWMEGAGDELSPVSLPFDVPALLVNPRQEVATQAVYQKVKPPYSPHLTLPTGFATLAALLEFLRSTHNALEEPALSIAPIIRKVMHDVSFLPGCLLSRMSGSGATCFGIFPSQKACINAGRELENLHPNWWIKPALLRGTYGQKK